MDTKLWCCQGAEQRTHIRRKFKKEGIEANYYDEVVNEVLPGQVVITGEAFRQVLSMKI